jgi:hypothetical protein
MRGLLPLLVVAAVGLSGVAPRAGQATNPTAPELAARLQTRYESIRDFTADFSQTYRGVLQRKTRRRAARCCSRSRTACGSRTSRPSKSLRLGRHTFKSYYKETARVGVSLPKDNEASTALLFLAGRGNLARDFTPTIAAARRRRNGTWASSRKPSRPTSTP